MHRFLRETPSSHGILRRGIQTILATSALLALAACGGGGGGGSNPPAAPPATNAAPTVNAGADATAALPNATVALTGSATDDGPAASLVYTWSSSNAAATTFSAPNAAATNATFNAAGTYTLTLTVSDGTQSSTDSLVVTVSAAPGGNAPPVVSAGADATTTLPNASVSLAGSATDDGPAASLTYTWSGTGPAAVAFANANAAATSATFTAAGSYTLTLTVNDGTSNGTDTLVVTVNAAGAAIFPAADDDSDTVNHGWQKVDAAAAGMTQAGLDTAATFAQNVPPGGQADSGSGMIVRHGQLVHSWGDIDKRKEVKSVTKSMGGIVLGLAIDDAKVTLGTKGVDIMPTFGTPPATNATDAQTITIAQLATHTAGFRKQDGDFTTNPAPLEFTPGTTWSYSDAGLNWLADVLTTAYQQDLSSLATSRVWSVLGLNGGGTNTDDVVWQANGVRPQTRDGGTIQFRELASGIQTNTNAMARVGLLFLRKGMWNGQRVVSEAFVEQAHTPLPENATLTLNQPNGFNFPGATTDYGVLWWTNKSGRMANVPTDTYWAWGLGEALIVVIPSLDLVIVRNGGQSPGNSSPGVRAWNDDRWDGDVTVLEPFLDPIVQATTP